MKQSQDAQLKDGGRSAAYAQYYKSLGYFNELEVYRLQDLTKKMNGDSTRRLTIT